MTYINLDDNTTNKIMYPTDPTLTATIKKGLPTKSAKILTSKLETILFATGITVGSVVNNSCSTPAAVLDDDIPALDTNEIREAFLSFMIDLLYDYDCFLSQVHVDWRKDCDDWFHTADFVAKVRKLLGYGMEW